MGTIKTAISIDESLFNKVKNLSTELHLSRSKIFSQAVEYFITDAENLELLASLNESFSSDLNGVDRSFLKQAKQNYLKRLRDEDPWI